MPMTPEPSRRVAWISRLARLEPVAFSRWDALHAALSVAIPTVVGVAIGQGANASLFALGALPAITGDRTGPYRARARSILLTVATGVAGFYAGMLIHTVGLESHWLAHVLLQLAILLLSFIGTFGNVASAATLQGAVYLIVGWGLALPPPEWRAPLLLAAGGIFSVMLMAIHWLRHPGAAERDAVAAIYQQLANVLDASGTPRVRLARRSLENAIAAAYDTLLTARASTASGWDVLERRAAQILAAEPVTAAVIGLAQVGQPLPAPLGRALYAMARSIARDHPINVSAAADAATDNHAPALAAALHRAEPLLTGTVHAAEPPLVALARHQARAPAHPRWMPKWPWPDVWRYLVRIGLCVLVAQIFIAVTALPRSYWVPLIVVVIFKPNYGSVFARALQSGVGSIIGVALSAAVVAIDRNGLVSFVALIPLAACLPWALRRNYGLFSALLLPILMLVMGALQPGSQDIALARFIDAVAACAIVLLVGYLPWAKWERRQLDERVAIALDALGRYAALADTHDADAAFAARRASYKALDDARIALQRALSEPPLVSRRAARWWPALISLERVANAITDTVPHGDDHDAAVHPAAAVLTHMAAALRHGGAAPDLPAPPVPGIDRMLDEALREAIGLLFGAADDGREAPRSTPHAAP
ncbi:Inner membrane protein YccS [Pandoraea pneumonica]|uniref:Inner membrane protein YccS n=1 Tax=Pandoraea pneumonica TaxID=2508299 RepID=A0A5E4S0X7_9BURK|nr:FUSC family protein [Pandoraea pneumonica]VVD67739.1 Inner membrane protein YccS [Pandoraea pneumonica]